jgi:hypothetical protein
MSSSDKRRITVALRHLNQAWLRELPSDVALEIGITIEALLSEPNDPLDSISYRIQMRAAVLLGGTVEERDAIAKQISTIYAFRSAAAHGMDLDAHWRGAQRLKVSGKRYTAHDMDDVFRNGRHLCARIARALLSLTRIPDYRTMVLLGAVPAPPPPPMRAPGHPAA